MDQILNAIAETLSEFDNVTAVRIMDGGIDASFGAVGSVRVTVERQ